MVARVRGTRDIVDTRLLLFAVDTISKQLQRYHFNQILTPVLEPIALFKRSLGIDTDVVSKEMFTVSSSSAAKEEDEICLRPEATASTVRAFLDAGIQTLPWKVFLWGPMFRYERPQKGRYREFYQCSMELIGAHSLAYDAQLISMLDRLFKDGCKLEGYALHLNFLGCSADRARHKEVVTEFLNAHADKLCATCQHRRTSNVLRVFDCKNEECQKLYRTAPRLTDFLCSPCAVEWQELQHRLEELSVPFVVMPYLVRGLDYYNKTVFEFVSLQLGSQTAFCGGGRYDKLVSELGGKDDQPAVGAAIGLDRLVMLLEQVEQSLLLPYQPALSVIVPLSVEQHPLALQIADALVRADLCVDVFFDGSVKSMMRKADKMAAKVVIFIGQDEQNTGTLKIKQMQTGQETVIKQIEIVQFVKNLK